MNKQVRLFLLLRGIHQKGKKVHELHLFPYAGYSEKNIYIHGIQQTQWISAECRSHCSELQVAWLCVAVRAGVGTAVAGPQGCSEHFLGLALQVAEPHYRAVAMTGLPLGPLLWCAGGLKRQAWTCQSAAAAAFIAF